MTKKKLYKIPVMVSKSAEKGLRLRERYGRGGTDVGIRTANILVKGGEVEYKFVKKVSEYFLRHEGDRLDLDGTRGKEVSNGYIAWMLWGGWNGWDWSRRVVIRRNNWGL